MAYKEMAALYDTLMAHAPYEEWVQFTERIFKATGKDIGHVVDLGCGTGEITLKLAQSGYEVIGVDSSQEMLSYAQHKEKEMNVNNRWLHQDIRSLSGLKDVDAAVSFCDVINYITEPEEVKQTFQAVYDMLKDDGIFIFDVHALEHVKENYIGQTFADVTDDVSYIWFCSEGDSVGEMYHDLTFFARNGSDYVRFDEQHHQRTYSIKFYKDLLNEIGFENVKVYADFSIKENNITKETERIFFFATKAPR